MNNELRSFITRGEFFVGGSASLALSGCSLFSTDFSPISNASAVYLNNGHGDEHWTFGSESPIVRQFEQLINKYRYGWHSWGFGVEPTPVLQIIAYSGDTRRARARAACAGSGTPCSRFSGDPDGVTEGMSILAVIAPLGRSVSRLHGNDGYLYLDDGSGADSFGNQLKLVVAKVAPQDVWS